MKQVLRVHVCVTVVRIIGYMGGVAQNANSRRDASKSRRTLPQLAGHATEMPIIRVICTDAIQTDDGCFLTDGN